MGEGKEDGVEGLFWRRAVDMMSGDVGCCGGLEWLEDGGREYWCCLGVWGCSL